jgi:streptomycin 6-kinase
MTPHDDAIRPAPNDDEAAAIVAAIMAHLAATRPTTPDEITPQPSAWSLAGRLASQGQPLARTPGVHPTWANAARLERTRRDG